MVRNRRIALSLLCLGTLGGCGIGTGGSPTSPPRVLADRSATCPLRSLASQANTHLPLACSVGRRENAVGGYFKRPNTLWGVAYAFNCGSHPAQFRWQVGMPGGDVGVPNTGTWTTARKGRGYQMMTTKRLAALQGAPPMWKSEVDIEIVSRCTWHMISLTGTESQVKAAIPHIPVYRKPAGTA